MPTNQQLALSRHNTFSGKVKQPYTLIAFRKRRVKCQGAAQKGSTKNRTAEYPCVTEVVRGWWFTLVSVSKSAVEVKKEQKKPTLTTLQTLYGIVH